MKIFALSLLFSLSVAIDFLPPQDPVIGILSTPLSTSVDYKSVIKVHYPEFVQDAGAKAIPILWDIDEERFLILLESVNGVLLQSDGALLWEENKDTGVRVYSAYQKRINQLVNFVIEKKKQGVHFPLWVVCQGFEAVTISLTEDLFVLDTYVHAKKFTALHFTDDAYHSTMFQHFFKESFDSLQNYPALEYWSEYGVNISAPVLYPVLDPSRWVVTGTSKDINGKDFLSAMESKEYPIFMYMFSPEKILYQARHDPASKHLSSVVLAVKLMAKSFITEAKKNENRFEERQLLKALLIENFPIENLGKDGLAYAFFRDSIDKAWVQDSGYWIWFVILFVAVACCACFKSKKLRKKKHSKPLLPKEIELEVCTPDKTKNRKSSCNVYNAFQVHHVYE